MTFKERVEANAVLWLLGSLLTGFLSGISAYRAVQEIGGLEPVSRADYEDLQKQAKDLESRNKELQSEIDQVKNNSAGHGGLTPPHRSIAPSYPELKNVSVRVWFPNRLAPKAAEIQDKLEKLGMAVKLSPHEPKVDQSLESVYYFKSGYAPAAVRLAEVLREYGFISTRFGNSPQSTDLVIWLWSQ